jgi:putative tryptophan/tyrosine transport system substrate-binding protein
MRRRAFIAGLGAAAVSAAVRPRAARTQQRTPPIVGYLNAQSATAAGIARSLAAFHRGLRDVGYVEGQNVVIEYRWAEGRYDRLPALAGQLISRPAAVIVATGGDFSVRAAKAATATIPIVFTTSSNPVQNGLVASLNRPGGNVTGVTNLGVELAAKKLELLHELVPTASDVALLINPNNANAETVLRETQAAARVLGVQLHVLRASTDRDIDAVFASLAQLRAGALVIGADAYFTTRSEQIATLTLRYAVPTIYEQREYVAAGGLMSYGSNFTELNRLVGVYTGRILTGEKPGDLPVQQSTKVELVINLKTAKALGLTFPLTLLGRADEVIE